MSITGFFGPNSTVLRLKEGDVPASDVPGMQGGAEVLSGRISMEEALGRAAHKGMRFGRIADWTRRSKRLVPFLAHSVPYVEDGGNLQHVHPSIRGKVTSSSCSASTRGSGSHVPMYVSR
jgi:hypothetical protein